MHSRIVKSSGDILILAELQNGPMNGYDVIAFIHNKFEILVSSGTVYSLLYSPERDERIKGKWAERERAYELTEKGEKLSRLYSTPTRKIKDLITSLLLNH